jgi:glycosyltransferase involved in cell wall biosynthesis
MDFTKQVVVINPMSSCRPTGLGVAGEGLLNYFPECRDRFSDKIYRIINDRIKSGLLRIVFRQMATEFFAWRHRRKLLICSTHQGALLRHGCSVVFIHDFTTLRRPFQNRAQVMGFLFLLPRIAMNATVLVAISNHAREELRRYLPGVNQKKVHVIPSISPRLERFKKGGDDWQARLKKKRFLFVGANFLHKKLDVAIQAVIELSKKGLNPGLDIVGVPESLWEKSFGFKFADLKQFGIVAKTYVSDEDLEKLYSEATALLFLSECEGLGFPPLEAMRKNCPVLCNDTPELRDTCGDAAIFVDITQPGAVAGVLEQILLGNLSGELNGKIILGQEQVAKFERQNIAPKWNGVFHDLAGALPGQPGDCLTVSQND